jgi:hypothetical protein
LFDLSLPVTLRFIRFLVEQLDLKIQVLYDRLVSRLNFSDLKVLLLLVEALAFQHRFDLIDSAQMVAHLDFVFTHLLLDAVDLPEVLFDLLKSLNFPKDLRYLTANLCFLISFTDLLYFCDEFRIDQIHRQIYLTDIYVFLY